MRNLWACTIVSKNYLPYARVLARSFLQYHPASRFFLLLADRVDGAFDPAQEPFELIEAEGLGAESLGIEGWSDFAFKYTILELNTAVKPAFLARLFELGADKLIYFDPDIWIAHRLDELSTLLDQNDVVLTPHLTDPIDDGYHPGEVHILQSGAYNLGFIALRAGETARRLVAWWHDRVYDRCVVDIPKGLFVDQKWIDLAPGLFDGVFVLREPGYNVAYWNLHGREVKVEGSGAKQRVSVNGSPLHFFHFSGVDPRKPSVVSKHQNRYTSSELKEERQLYQEYRERLLAEGFLATERWPYVWGAFADGTSIPDVARSLFRSLPRTKRAAFGDPFSIGPGSFFEWLRSPVRSGARITQLQYHIYRLRDDLVESHPDVLGRDQERFVHWLQSGGAEDYRLPQCFQPEVTPQGSPSLEGVRGDAKDRDDTGASVRLPPPSLTGTGRRLARRLYHSAMARDLKFRLRRALGSERTEALKQRLGRSGPPSDERPRETLAERVSGLVLQRPGINVCGYLTAESGMGEGVRSIVRSLDAAEVPYTLCNLELGVASRTADRSFRSFDASWAYDVNLFFVNADQVPHVVDFLGRQVFERRYNVGLWLWELEEFPRQYWSSFRPFHEIWTPSSFCQESLSRVAPIPVRRVPLAVELEQPSAAEIATIRRQLDLEADVDTFTFLFTFDYLSYAERKNPRGLIEAFRRAFPAAGAARQGKPRLVIKTINRNLAPEQARALERAAEGLPVRFIDLYLDKREVHALAASCDAYVSLHRSEGFGLTVAEAMRLGKPVIATAYGGTTDFLRAGTGFPVAYDLVANEDLEGPYPAGALWAEPDVADAARLMQLVVEERPEAVAMGLRGQQEVERTLSARAVGDGIARWLRRLEARLERPGSA
jgi:glycosyltransferase involved in cell wall biosynthesis